jgi:hypothetical protein
LEFKGAIFAKEPMIAAASGESIHSFSHRRSRQRHCHDRDNVNN